MTKLKSKFTEYELAIIKDLAANKGRAKICADRNISWETLDDSIRAIKAKLKVERVSEIIAIYKAK